MSKATTREPRTEKFIRSDGQEVEITHGSGNVFADLGYADAEVHKFKSRLMMAISDVAKERGLTQAQVGEIVGLSQGRVSELMSGRFRDISVEGLFKILLRLGHGVEVRIDAKEREDAEMRLVA